MQFHTHYLLAALAFATVHAEEKTKVVTPQDFEKLVYKWSDTLAQTLQIIGEKHIDVSHFEEAMENGLKGICSTLDPHSDFFSAQEHKRVTTMMSGTFYGIGVVIDATRQSKERHLTILDVIPDGPADLAGLRPMDKIIEIDGQTLEGMTTDEATTKLKGARNTVVHVKVLRDSNTLVSCDITRDKIKEHSTLCFYFDEHRICYLSLSVFSEQAVHQLRKRLDESNKQQCTALILDLRNNSGGLLQSALDIAGLFVEKSSLVVTTKDRTGKEIERYLTKHEPIAHGMQFIVILINNFTASAAEILAGCLKIHAETAKKKQNPLVLLVGTRTFGKGSVQEIIPIGNDCAVKLTTSLYYLADDHCIQATGIEPDLTVEKLTELPENTQWYIQHYGHEESLTNAIGARTQGANKPTEPPAGTEKTDKKAGAPAKSWQERSKEALSKDNQIREAVTLIKTLEQFKNLAPKQMKNRADAVAFIQKHYAPGASIAMTEVKM